MADHFISTSASTVLQTGPGFVVGIVITSSSGAPQVSLFNNTAGSGTKIFDCFVSYLAALQIFFPEKYALYFTTGLYVNVAANAVVNIWWRSL